MNKTTAYVVQQGDTLWQIGEWYGVHWTTLAKFNNLKNPHLIYPGDEILIPGDEIKKKTLRQKISQLFR